MSLKITLDFDKHTISKGAINILSNGLQDDPERDVIMLSLKECLAKMVKGNKLPYKAANYLLINILNAITIEGSDTSDEIRPVTHPDPQVWSEDQSQQSQDGCEDTTQGPTCVPSGSDLSPKAMSNLDQKSPSKKKETCRFYTRGHCNRGNDCRYDHPSICKKFRQFGSKSTDQKGCDGKCNAFHPNACRSSLKDKTCTFNECRFFHLKGTRRLTINKGQSDVTNRNWRTTSKTATEGNHPRSLNSGKHASKNWQTSANQKKKKPQNHDPNVDRLQTEQVVREEKHHLGRTLDAIMQRLAAMEARQPMYLHPPVHPLLSPTVPQPVTQPGTQTQYQQQLWASQPPWTQPSSQA